MPSYAYIIELIKSLIKFQILNFALFYSDNSEYSKDKSNIVPQYYPTLYTPKAKLFKFHFMYNICRLIMLYVRTFVQSFSLVNIEAIASILKKLFPPLLITPSNYKLVTGPRLQRELLNQNGAQKSWLTLCLFLLLS